MSNGVCSEGRTSPSSGAASPHDHRTGNCSDGSGAAHSVEGRRSPKLSLGKPILKWSNEDFARNFDAINPPRI